jgi:HAMP domain-containing protein
MLAPAGSLVHRYLILSLLFSVVPIVAIGAAYHAFISDIISQTTIRQLQNDLQFARNNVRSVLNSFDLRLQSLADLPELSWIDPDTVGSGLSPTLQTIFDFELDSPDLYAIGLIDTENREVLVVPHSAMSELGLSRDSLPISKWQSATMIGPSIGPAGRPGWVGLQRQIRSQTSSIRAVILWIRLAALTEASKSIDRINLSRPMIATPSGRYDVVGSPVAEEGDVLMTSEIVPGWHLEVVLTGTPTESLGNLRWALLVIVLISGLAIALVFRRLSYKLDSRIAPLVEGARLISRGDLSVRVPETSGGEVGTLAHAFNQMGDSLRQTVTAAVHFGTQAKFARSFQPRDT